MFDSHHLFMEEKPIEIMHLHDHYEVRVWVAAFEHACKNPDLYHTSDEVADVAVRQFRNRRERVVDTQPTRG